MPDLEAAYQAFKPYGLARDFQTEIIGRIELFTIATQLNLLASEKSDSSAYQKTLKTVREKLEDLFREFNPEVDRSLFAALMEIWVKGQDPAALAPQLKALLDKAGGNFTKLAEEVYASSELDNGKKMLSELEMDPRAWVARYLSDPAFQLFTSISAHYTQTYGSKLPEMQNRINSLLRNYMQAQMEVFPEKKFYPDANSTLRVTYGKVNGYTPRDAVQYDHYTYLDGVMEKYKPGDYEFDLPAKMLDLYKAKEYGPYGSGGKMPVCFIGTNHTTGGNSGSPALDAYGNLVGLNFDRVWEGTMSDLNYDPSICRNIMVDIRYVLFIVDKFAGATNLIAEMKLVHPKKKTQGVKTTAVPAPLP